MEQKILEHFYWPSIGADICSYCRFYEKCQRRSAKDRAPPVLLKPFHIITEPSSHETINLAGPLSPPSFEGRRHIPILVDYSAGFPEPVLLKVIGTILVTEALLAIFYWVGIPIEILSSRELGSLLS